MAKTSLSAAAIKAAKATGKVYRLRDHQPDDPDLKGFHLTVSAHGAKAFAVSYTSPIDDARRFFTLGAYPAMTLTAARRRCREERARIRQGVDPQLEAKGQRKARRSKHQARREAGTVKDALELYVKDLRMDGKRSADEVERVFSKHFIPEIGDTPVEELTEDAVLDCMAAFGEHRVLHDRARSYMVSAFRLARKAHRSPRWRGKVRTFKIPFDVTDVIPRAVVGREAPATRALSPAEIATVWNHFAADDLSVAAIRLLLATGQRVEEVLHAEWIEFDLDDGVWTIPADRRKARHHLHVDHLVPLNDIALDVLEGLPRFKKCPYLFPATGLKVPRHSATLSKATRRWCDANDFPAFTPRDLRRTWKQRAGRELRIDLELRNRVQGHAFADIGSRAYDGLDDPAAYLPEKREALDKWGAWLARTVSGKGAKVVSLREGAGR